MSAQQQTDQTAEELVQSLTGFDEVAIANAFGAEAMDLADHKPTMFVRSLIFVDLTRKGKDPKTAKRDSMGLTIRQTNEYFASGEDEAFEDEPVTEAGKDDSDAA